MSDVIKLSTALKTRFIISSMKQELDRVLTGFIGQDVVVDLCDCKMSPNCAAALKNYFSKLVFQDSQNAHQNAYLLHNMQAAKDKVVQREHIPVNLSIQPLMTYMGEMEPGKVYDLKYWEDDPASMRAFVILVQMSRPEITVDLGKYAVPVFAEVRRHWIYGTQKHDAYWELVGAVNGRGIVGSFEAIVRRDVVNDTVYVPGEGTMTTDIYLHEFYAIPYSFGTEKVVQNREFSDLLDWAAQTLERKVASIPTMLSYIEKRS